MMRRTSIRRTTRATLLGTLLLAAGCGGGESTTPTTTTAAPTTTVASTTTTTTLAPTTTTTVAPTATTTVAPTTTTTVAPTTTTTTTTTIVLTDSFRGVTAEAIEVGLASIDFEGLNRDFGLSLTYANFGPFFEALVADLNERGGILGRRVNLTTRTFIPVGPVSADAACIELTEDEQVFVVLNGFAGPGAESVNECFTDIHATNLIGGHPAPEQLERAQASWIAYDISFSRRGLAFINLLRETGWLDDLGPYLLYGSNPDYQLVLDDMKVALEAEGQSVPVVAVNEVTGDETATIAFLEVLMEKARSEGVASFVQVGEGVYSVEYVIGLGDEFNLLIHNGDSIGAWTQEPPPGIEDAGLILTNRNFPSRDDPSWGRCLEIADAVAETEVRPPDDLVGDETNYWAAMSNACQSLALFEMIATAAGPDLTNESFAAAAASLDNIELPGYAFASLGPGKFDARDSLTLTRWDSEASAFEAISEAVDTTG